MLYFDFFRLRIGKEESPFEFVDRINSRKLQNLHLMKVSVMMASTKLSNITLKRAKVDLKFGSLF